MSGKRHKKLRKQIFGEGKEGKQAFKNRRYGKRKKKGNKIMIVSDPQRRIYQKMKKATKGA